jgi:hypothetical protein
VKEGWKKGREEGDGITMAPRDGYSEPKTNFLMRYGATVDRKKRKRKGLSSAHLFPCSASNTKAAHFSSRSDPSDGPPSGKEKRKEMNVGVPKKMRETTSRGETFQGRAVLLLLLLEEGLEPERV